MMKREDIEKFVKNQMKEKDDAHDFEYLDSLQKLELVMECEKEYGIGITEDDIENDCNTDRFIEMVYNKILR